MGIFSGQRSADMESSLEGTEMSSDMSVSRTRIRTLTLTRFELRTWKRTYDFLDEQNFELGTRVTDDLNCNILQTDSCNMQLVSVKRRKLNKVIFI